MRTINSYYILGRHDLSCAWYVVRILQCSAMPPPILFLGRARFLVHRTLNFLQHLALAGPLAVCTEMLTLIRTLVCIKSNIAEYQAQVAPGQELIVRFCFAYTDSGTNGQIQIRVNYYGGGSTIYTYVFIRDCSYCVATQVHGLC
jgi:hypothetical protein